MENSWMPKLGTFQDFFEVELVREKRVMANLDSIELSIDENEMREERMIQKLAHYPLLCDIPVHYLIPFSSMLGENQIRFFYIDQNWIRSLVDGMVSPGRSAAIDQSHDRALVQKVYERAITESSVVRQQLQGKEFTNENFYDTSLICTGFVMRSPMVRGWRGIEFQAYGLNGGKVDEDNPLRALRIETLSDEILIGIFAGEIARLDISEPPEGLHYGLISDDGTRSIRLRNLEDGTFIDKKPVRILEHGNRVVNIAGTAEALCNSLGLAKDSFNSAHFALQLLRTAKRLEIREVGCPK